MSEDHEAAMAVAVTRGHAMQPWGQNLYRPGMVTSCRRCGAMLIEDVTGPHTSTFAGGTLRRTCQAILASKAKRRKA